MAQEETAKLTSENKALGRRVERMAKEMKYLVSLQERALKLREYSEREKDMQYSYNFLLLNNAPDTVLVFIMNPEMRFQLGTKSFLRFLGREDSGIPLDDSFDAFFNGVMPDDWIRETRAVFASVMNRREQAHYNSEVILAGGRKVFTISIVPAVDSRDNLVGVICVMEDNTELVEMKEVAEAATLAKSSFLAKMSHEIRTPLNAIMGIAKIQLQNGGLPDKQETALKRIYDSGSTLLGIINDILDMSKIESGKMELNPINYDIPSLINDAVQFNIARISQKPIEFIIDIDKNLPSRLYGDELRLKQVLNNLLSNAIKYTEKGYVRLSADHFMADDGDIILRFKVEDSGQGMKPEDREKLFSEYQRFNAEANRTTEGTGIGLNITMNLIKMMDGEIKVESEYGKGSVFTATVRQKPVECDPIGAELSERLRNFTFSGERQSAELRIIREVMPYGRVLVVDDVETNLYVAEGLLAPYRLTTETVASGFAAIEKTEKSGKYDVIFMDHMMPLMDGIETTKKLREAGYDGAIVALTANALTGNDEMFRQNGFDGFIAKPIDIRQLDEALNKFVRDRHPVEAGKYKREQPEPAEAQSTAISPKLLQVFCRDAEKAVITLRECIANGDVKLFTTTAHAMKSALANIGEVNISATARALEEAGLNADSAYIAVHTESFIASLEGLVKNSAVSEDVKNSADAEGGGAAEEDTVHLKEQLRLAGSACGDYDDKAAYAALDRLKGMPYKPETVAALDGIRDMLFLHSDFEGAGERIQGILDSLPG